MVKKLSLLLIAGLSLWGCAYEGRTLVDFIEDPRAIIKDPHFADYKEKRDALESHYLHKEIDYAQYVEQMDALDQQYTKEVKERDESMAAPY